jgi:hypothetical protein
MAACSSFREADILGLHRGVDRDPLKVLAVQRPAGMRLSLVLGGRSHKSALLRRRLARMLSTKEACGRELTNQTVESVLEEIAVGRRMAADRWSRSDAD